MELKSQRTFISASSIFGIVFGFAVGVGVQDRHAGQSLHGRGTDCSKTKRAGMRAAASLCFVSGFHSGALHAALLSGAIHTGCSQAGHPATGYRRPNGVRVQIKANESTG